MKPPSPHDPAHPVLVRSFDVRAGHTTLHFTLWADVASQPTGLVLWRDGIGGPAFVADVDPEDPDAADAVARESAARSDDVSLVSGDDLDEMFGT